MSDPVLFDIYPQNWLSMNRVQRGQSLYREVYIILSIQKSSISKRHVDLSIIDRHSWLFLSETCHSLIVQMVINIILSH